MSTAVSIEDIRQTAEPSDPLQHQRPWTLRERLALVSAVERVGDRAWNSVARLVAPLSDGPLPPEQQPLEGDAGFFSARACSRSYARMVSEEAPPAADNDAEKSAAGRATLVQRLTRERIAELQQLLETVSQRYRQLMQNQQPEPDVARRRQTPTRQPRQTGQGVYVVSDAELALLKSPLPSRPESRRRRLRQSDLPDGDELPAAGDVEDAAAEAEDAADDAAATASLTSAADDFGEKHAAAAATDPDDDAASAYDVEATEADNDDAQTVADSVSLSASLNAAVSSHTGAAAAAATVGASATERDGQGVATVAANAVPPVAVRAVPAKDYIDSPDPADSKAVKQWRRQIQSVIRLAMCHKHGSVFTHPVTEEIAPGYSKVVFQPMDLSTLKRMVDSGEVATTRSFLRQLFLIYFNAVMYNNADQPVHSMAMEIWEDTCGYVADALCGGGGGGGGGGGSGVDSIGGGVGGSGGVGDETGGGLTVKSLRHHRRSEQLLQHHHLHHHHLHHSQQPAASDDTAAAATAAAAAHLDDSASSAAPPSAKKPRRA